MAIGFRSSRAGAVVRQAKTMALAFNFFLIEMYRSISTRNVTFK